MDERMQRGDREREDDRSDRAAGREYGGKYGGDDGALEREGGDLDSPAGERDEGEAGRGRASASRPPTRPA